MALVSVAIFALALLIFGIVAMVKEHQQGLYGGSGNGGRKSENNWNQADQSWLFTSQQSSNSVSYSKCDDNSSSGDSSSYDGGGYSDGGGYC